MRVGDEGLLGGGGGTGFVKPESNQQIRGQADEFPANEKEEEACWPMTRPSIAAAKQRQETEKAREIFVVRHVAHAVNENEQA